MYDVRINDNLDIENGAIEECSSPPPKTWKRIVPFPIGVEALAKPQNSLTRAQRCTSRAVVIKR